jgi:hypothetical protein
VGSEKYSLNISHTIQDKIFFILTSLFHKQSDIKWFAIAATGCHSLWITLLQGTSAISLHNSFYACTQTAQFVTVIPPPCAAMNCKMFSLFLAAAWWAAALPLESRTPRRPGSARYRRLKSSTLPLSAAYNITHTLYLLKYYASVLVLSKCRACSEEFVNVLGIGVSGRGLVNITVVWIWRRVDWYTDIEILD